LKGVLCVDAEDEEVEADGERRRKTTTTPSQRTTCGTTKPLNSHKRGVESVGPRRRRRTSSTRRRRSDRRRKRPGRRRRRRGGPANRPRHGLRGGPKDGRIRRSHLAQLLAWRLRRRCRAVARHHSVGRAPWRPARPAPPAASGRYARNKSALRTLRGPCAERLFVEWHVGSFCSPFWLKPSWMRRQPKLPKSARSKP